jgi:hypothetical protein
MFEHVFEHISMTSMLQELTGRMERTGLPGMLGERSLPVLPPLTSLLPWEGLQRGTTVAVHGSTSLILALMAGPSQAGSWCAVVGLGSLGAVAAAEMGVALDRLALVPAPGPEWPVMVAALLDALDLVVVAPPERVRGSDARRLSARARQRGSVLVPCGQWEGADLRLSVDTGVWEGLGTGHGHLQARRVTVSAEGRGAAARWRQVRLWLPAADGEIRHGDDMPADLAVPRGPRPRLVRAERG